MNNKNATPHYHDEYPYKVPFRVRGHLALIHSLSEKGVVIKVDQTYRYACACFNNIIDYNDFKRKISNL